MADSDFAAREFSTMDPVDLAYPPVPQHLACLKARNPFDAKDATKQKLYRQYCHPYPDFFKILDLKLLKETGLLELDDVDLVWNREGLAKVAYYDRMIEWLANGACAEEEHRFVLRSPLNRPKNEATLKSVLETRIRGVTKDRNNLVEQELKKTDFYQMVFGKLRDKYWQGEQIFNRTKQPSSGRWTRVSFLDPLGTVTLFRTPEEYFATNFTASKAIGVIEQEIDPTWWRVIDVFASPKCGPTLVTLETQPKMKKILVDNGMKLPHMTQHNVEVVMKGISEDYDAFVSREEDKLAERHKGEICLARHKSNPHPVNSQAWTRFNKLVDEAAKSKAAAVQELNKMVKVAKEYQGERWQSYLESNCFLNSKFVPIVGSLPKASSASGKSVTADHVLQP